MNSSKKESAWPVVAAAAFMAAVMAATTFGPNDDTPEKLAGRAPVNTDLPPAQILADEIADYAKLPDGGPSVAEWCGRAPDGQTPCP